MFRLRAIARCFRDGFALHLAFNLLNGGESENLQIRQGRALTGRSAIGKPLAFFNLAVLSECFKTCFTGATCFETSKIVIARF